MKNDPKSFTAFLKKRAPIYLGLIGIFLLFAYPALIEKNLQSHIPTDLTPEEQVVVDLILSYNGLNNSGMTIMNVLEEEISTKYSDEKIDQLIRLLLRHESVKDISRNLHKILEYNKNDIYKRALDISLANKKNI